MAARQWALLNPDAWEKKPLTHRAGADVAHGELSAHGARLLPRDRRRRRDRADLRGAREDAARSRRPTCSAPASRSPTPPSRSMPDLTVTGARRSGAQAYAMAGLEPRPTSTSSSSTTRSRSTPLLFLEDLGFCPKGEGGRFVAGGAHRAGRPAAGQHQRRRPVLLPPGHVRPVPADRSGAAAARRMRRAAGAGLRDRRSRTAMAACCRARAPCCWAAPAPSEVLSAPVKRGLRFLPNAVRPSVMVVRLRQLRPDQQLELEELLRAG